jgi:uncharacterized protein YbjT (DUF2867 family)
LYANRDKTLDEASAPLMILVTGASGNVGSCVVRQLIEAGEPVRALTRHPQSARFPDRVEVIAGDLADPTSLAPAFVGVDRMFFFTPPQGGVAVVQAARAAGVERVVVLSSAATQKTDPRVNPIAARHDAVEKAVQKAGLGWTFLRPDTFASNALSWAASIRLNGVVRGAYRKSLRNPIHEADIAAVATAALLDTRHLGAAYLLTGPALISQEDQVKAIGAAAGKTIRFEELTREQALAEMLEKMPAPIAERLLDYAAKSVHTPPLITSDVERATGRPARPFAEWASDHAASFR